MKQDGRSVEYLRSYTSHLNVITHMIVIRQTKMLTIDSRFTASVAKHQHEYQR